MSTGPPRLAVVVTCMGRLEFVRWTAPLLLADERIEYCLVDYSCPQNTGAWLEGRYPELVASGRATVVRLPGHRFFHKCAALNAGARQALQNGAEYLAFLDADTLVRPGFVDFVLDALHPNRFLIAGRDVSGNDDLNLIGVVVVPAAAFGASGGFDESFTHWGLEDIDYRLRLFLVEGLDYAEIPFELLQAIPHSAELRFRYSTNRDLGSCLQAGWSIIQRKLSEDWPGLMKRPFHEAERLYVIKQERRPRGRAGRPAATRPVRVKLGW